ncbi:hypothetical protein K7432_014062 [Basidiobolus ranarum]|uniref:Esterase n=1 Tax=Basidiobolus ranarum TaxID=34480 RepID=A0ABR2VQ53_9FUNG
MKKLTLFILFLCLFTLSNVRAQSSSAKPFVVGKVEEIQSSVLGEQRTLNIYLPDGYDNKNSSGYPVIYLLDGSANEDFIHVTGLVQFFNMIETLPKSIVVGIANVDRKRDFTFPTTIEKDKEDFPTTGGSQKFIEFLQSELQPFVEKKYRTNGSKTIIGQSLGGLLGTEILLKEPSLFTSYIIVSPSLWWDNESLLVKAPELLKSGGAENIKVFLTVGTEGQVMENDAASLANILKTNATDKIQLNFSPLPEENHLTILNRAIYKAFESLKPKL